LYNHVGGSNPSMAPLFFNISALKEFTLPYIRLEYSFNLMRKLSLVVKLVMNGQFLIMIIIRTVVSW